MAKIPLSGGFTPIEEGITVLRIKSVDYKEDFGKLRIILENSKGKTLINDFNFGTSGDNQKAINAFSFFARTAMGNSAIDELDPEELVGKYVRAEIYHTQGTQLDADGKPRVFANAREYSYAESFDGAAPAPAPQEDDEDEFDLADILGD